MTKDWDAVRATIRELSVGQKKSLEDVKTIMEQKHKFRASTRAYRMKLKEWGFMRYKRRRGRDSDISMDEDEDEPQNPEDSETTLPAVDSSNTVMEDVPDDATPSIDPWTQARITSTNRTMDMLACVLEANSEGLEELILAHPDYVNMPIGLPFDAHGGRFFNHPAMESCVVLQHSNQTLLDVACGLPPSSIQWVLLSHQAKGSRHPLGTDLAFHNAIKNGRTSTLQSLIHSGHSNVHGFPEIHYKPLMQAAYWNVPNIVRILLDKGAKVDGAAAAFDGREFKSALQLALEKRAAIYHETEPRERSIKTIKMLLDAGANIHVPAAHDMLTPPRSVNTSGLTPFEAFLKPWNSNPLWVTCIEGTEMDCLEAFVRKGADLQSAFTSFPCSSPTSKTFEHQVLWHSTPKMARLIIDHATPISGANGANLLHEILGCCPDAKRHPADTLRDIDVILRKGGDPNQVDKNGITPLRKCIELCPGVDVVTRITALLERGADPELKDRSGVQLLVLAARAFSEPLLSQIMVAMMSKYRGRYPRGDQGSSSWGKPSSRWREGYFPIPNNPTATQVLRYRPDGGEFDGEVYKMLPSDVHKTVLNATITVASTRFLDSVTQRRTPLPITLTPDEKYDISNVIGMRMASELPPYDFNQDFVMALLTPHIPTGLSSATPIARNPPTSRNTPSPSPGGNFTASFFGGYTGAIRTPKDAFKTPKGAFELPKGAFETPTDAETTAIINDTHAMIDSATADIHAYMRTHHIPIPGDNCDGPSSSFFPETTQIRWNATGEATKSADYKKIKSLVLSHECKSCDNGVKLTKAEFEKHEAEHIHTLTCVEEGCKWRFCDAERGGRSVPRRVPEDDSRHPSPEAETSPEKESSS